MARNSRRLSSRITIGDRFRRRRDKREYYVRQVHRKDRLAALRNDEHHELLILPFGDIKRYFDELDSRIEEIFPDGVLHGVEQDGHR